MTGYVLSVNQEWVGDHDGEWFCGRGWRAVRMVAEACGRPQEVRRLQPQPRTD